MPDDAERVPASATLSELDPVQPTEELLRRVLYGTKKYNPSKSPPIMLGAFMPSRRDTDGLSLNRTACGVDAHLLKEAAPESIREKCGVIAILASTILEAGLEIRPDPIEGELPGHVLLPQLNYQDSESADEATRNRIRAWSQTLAARAYRLIEPLKK
jgi:hypothetical protein